MSACVPREGDNKLQRLLSSYPVGRHGIGLLILRVAIAITALVQGLCYFAENGNGTAVGSIVGIVLVLSGLALSVGFLTPLASALICILAVGNAALWIPLPMGSLFPTALHTALTVVIAISVTILGPGAYSVDARLFGRREIIIPRLPPRS